MSKKHCDKLVRDKTLEHIESDGKDYQASKARNESLTVYLHEKLNEEIAELFESVTDEQKAEEIADVREVLQAIENHLGINPVDALGKQVSKKQEYGGFDQGIILEWVEE